MLPRVISNSVRRKLRSIGEGISINAERAGASIAVLVAAALMVLQPAFGHHSFASEFDTTKPVSVTGTITKIDWTNPHTWFYVEGKDEKGDVVTWSFEGAAPSLLIRRGITKTTLKVGDAITIEGFQAKDGTNIASSTYVTYADGKKLRIGVVGGPSDQ